MKLVELRWLPGLKSLACGLAFAVQLLGAASASAEDRTISMYNIHTKESITVTFKKNGRFVPEALRQLNHFMRDWRRNQEINMDPALIDLIWELHQELGSKQPVHLICGYRSAKTNEFLRHNVGGQAKHSRHITGQAADLMFPDVPLKQLRYSALVMQKGGVGFYPASGIPFVHVDTGNVRHWPRMPRMELAVLFPNGHSRHIPADGRPLTPADARVALAKWKSSGAELPWTLTHKTAGGPMLASLGPGDMGLKAQPVSLSSGQEPARATPLPEPSLAKSEPDFSSPGEAPEPLLSEEGDEQDDEITFEPLPATFLLAEHPLSYPDAPDPNHPEVFPKIGMLLAPQSVLASEEFEHRLQIEALYEADRFKGPAITMMWWRKTRMMAVNAQTEQASR